MTEGLACAGAHTAGFYFCFGATLTGAVGFGCDCVGCRPACDGPRPVGLAGDAKRLADTGYAFLLTGGAIGTGAVGLGWETVGWRPRSPVPGAD